MNDDWQYDAKRELQEMDNKMQEEQHDAHKELIKNYQIKVTCLTNDIKTFVAQLTKAEDVVKLIADTYHLKEATGYFNNDSPKQN